MKVYYEANDGTIFTDESECLDHEFLQTIEDDLIYLIFYDAEGGILRHPLNEAEYGLCQTIIALTPDAITALHKIADYTGFCEYSSVTSIGNWEWEEGKGFIKK